jgi:CRP/FNR family transcriptional regulator, cyclic AMP receptor protein
MSNRHSGRAIAEALRREQEESAQRLREFPTFSKFSDDDLKRLVKAAHRTSTSGPWPLIREQTPSDACYILLSGEAGVYVGKNRIAMVGPGEIIGESALRRGKLRNATVTTAGRAEVLHIPRDDLDRLLTEISALRETMDETVKRHVPEASTAEPS